MSNESIAESTRRRGIGARSRRVARYWPGVLLALLLWLLVVPAWEQSAADGFNLDADLDVRVIVVQADGKALVGGNFTKIGEHARNRIARLNADGTLDAGFDPQANGQIDSVVVQADGKLLVAGGFTEIGGQVRNNACASECGRHPGCRLQSRSRRHGS